MARGYVGKQLVDAYNADLRKQLKKLAKKADVRMRQIERYTNPIINKERAEKYKGMKTAAYGKALKDIEYFSGEGAKRWDRDLKDLSIADVKKKIKAIETFLDSPSAYIRKRKNKNGQERSSYPQIVLNRTQALNKKFEVSLSPDQWKRVWERYDALQEKTGYSQAEIEALASSMYDTSFRETVEEYAKRIDRGDSPRAYNKWLREELKEGSLPENDLMSGSTIASLIIDSFMDKGIDPKMFIL